MFVIDHKQLTFNQLFELGKSGIKIELSEKAKQSILSCRAYLDDKIQRESKAIYGINTGFGALYHVKIKNDDLSELQENLVMSHACGVGEEVPQSIVKWMLFLKIKALSHGFSGVQLTTVERLIDFYNHDIIPLVYTQGSLGASGDLAPLAHLSLPLLGKGEVYEKGVKKKADEVLKHHGWKPIRLQSKEGLALLNGTQFMSAYGTFLILESYKLKYLADKISSLSLDAYDGRIEPFSALIQEIRPHTGQIKTAKRVRDFLKDSELINQEKKHVQDPYSFRCIPQVHGATENTLDFVKKTLATEVNAVTDNPTVFVHDDQIISGGNFHGQPLALALDYLGIAMSELANISERRIFQLVSGLRGLPPFLVAESGLNSGFMIPQYTAASIVSQNKQLATPASVDSIVSSNGQEDHVSMGANAATKAYQIILNTKKVLAIELLNAAQALEFRRPLKTAEVLEFFVEKFREKVPFVQKDEVLQVHIKNSVEFLDAYEVTMEEILSQL